MHNDPQLNLNLLAESKLQCLACDLRMKRLQCINYGKVFMFVFKSVCSEIGHHRFYSDESNRATQIILGQLKGPKLYLPKY